MKKSLFLILTLCLCFNLFVPLVFAYNSGNAHQFVNTGRDLYVLTNEYIDPYEYTSENSVFFDVPITQIKTGYFPETEEEKTSIGMYSYYISVADGMSLDLAIKTLQNEPIVRSVKKATYQHPGSEAKLSMKFELSDDGTYYNIVNIGSDVVDFVIPEEYNGLPVKGFGDPRYDQDEDTAVGWDIPFFNCTPTLETITLTDNIVYMVSTCIYRYYPHGLKQNEYNGLQYLGTEDNPYYALVQIPEKAGADIVLHPDTAIIGSEIAPPHYLNSIILSDSLIYISPTAFYSNYTFDGTQMSFAKHIKYNEYKGFKYYGTAENPYYALVGVADGNITEAEIHQDTKIIFPGISDSNITADKVENVTIPKSVISISEDAFYLFPSLKEINFEAKGKDEFKVCDVFNTLSEDINVNWGYVPTEPTPTEPTADESNGVGAFVWVGIGAIVVIITTVVVLKKKK